MKKALLSFLLSIFVVSLTFAAEKIVYIDTQKVFTESKAGIDLKTALQQKAEKARSEIQSKAATIQQNDQIAMQKLQQEAMEKQQEIQDLQQNAVEKFANFVKEAVEQWAKSKGYELVIDGQAVLYGKQNYDKTDEFLKFLNDKYAKEKPDFMKK
jgi:outer membrane protein